MARSGDRFQFPDGSTYIVNRSASESGGESVEMEFVLGPQCLPPPPHVHPHQVESYKVLEGSLELLVEGSWRTLRIGDSASVPVGMSHTFRNSSGSIVRVQNWHKPAMQFEKFIEMTSRRMASAGVRSKRDPRALIYLSMGMIEFSGTLSPSRKRELVPMQVMACVGRLLRMDGS